MTGMPILGLFETHLTVASLDASVTFYRRCRGPRPCALAGGARAAFFWVGGHGRTMLGLWETGRAPNAMRLHTAFTCELSDVVAAAARLRHAGIVPSGFDGEPVDEPVVIGWMPAVSVFFIGPGSAPAGVRGMLAETPRPDVGVVSYSVWQASL
jgi:lactoylglutathione lyase